jgi:hypothetical protein
MSYVDLLNYFQAISNAFADERFFPVLLVVVQLFLAQISTWGPFLGRKVTGV